jgi:hypothetical protein
MTAVVDTVNLTQTETVVVQSFPPESLTLTQTERVVEREETGTVIVTGVLAPIQTISINTAPDVDLTNLTDGATLVYSQPAAKWQATRELDRQVMNGGFF